MTTYATKDPVRTDDEDHTDATVQELVDAIFARIEALLETKKGIDDPAPPGGGPTPTPTPGGPGVDYNPPVWPDDNDDYPAPDWLTFFESYQPQLAVNLVRAVAMAAPGIVDSVAVQYREITGEDVVDGLAVGAGAAGLLFGGPAAGLAVYETVEEVGGVFLDVWDAITGFFGSKGFLGDLLLPVTQLAMLQPLLSQVISVVPQVVKQLPPAKSVLPPDLGDPAVLGQITGGFLHHLIPQLLTATREMALAYIASRPQPVAA